MLLNFEFGEQQREPRPGNVATGVLPLRPRRYTETWLAPGTVDGWCEDGICVVRSDDYMCVHATWDPADGRSICQATEALYQDMIALLIRHDFRQLTRAWNFVPEINQGDGDEERYRQFCLGRARALDASSITSEDLPAATAVGIQADCLMSVAIMASTVAARNIENPRQVEAYNYPRQYGPRGPSFSRATLLHSDRDGALLLTSGTASIRGHESVHSFDAPAQVEETMTNLEHVMQQAAGILGRADTGHRGSNLYRVYLRDPADLEGVSAKILSHSVSSSQLIFLQADICRRELGVEIEGVQYL